MGVGGEGWGRERRGREGNSGGQVLGTGGS